jgi:hypothetical protein
MGQCKSKDWDFKSYAYAVFSIVCKSEHWDFKGNMGQCKSEGKDFKEIMLKKS